MTGMSTIGAQRLHECFEIHHDSQKGNSFRRNPEEFLRTIVL